MDLMRLPLGILTGVGFIGAGTILKQGPLVKGVTTAATLWMATVIGLCFGGGQYLLGAAATLLCLLTLWILIFIDKNIKRSQRAVLVVALETESPFPPDLAPLLKSGGFQTTFRQQARGLSNDNQQKFQFDIHWRERDGVDRTSDILMRIAQSYYVERFQLISEDADATDG
jgi:putative Mg2+ transporter-C (MgtC) family protein